MSHSAVTTDEPVVLDGRTLQLEDVELVARGHRRVALAPEARERIAASNDQLTRLLADGRPIYGVNTGFGSLASRSIPERSVAELQSNLLRSHAAGSGRPLPTEVVRGIMLLRANSLAVGVSGVRIELVQMLIKMLNAGIHPLIPEQGSLGASGDLAPLAHVGLALIGEGYVLTGSGSRQARSALRDAGLSAYQLGPKEALALINGTPMMASLSALALLDAERLIESALGTAALSLYATGARRDPLDPRLHEARPHVGQIWVARLLGLLLESSPPSNRTARRIQDPYSMRCIPQVYGPILRAVGELRRTLEIEINSATDNPLLLPGDADPVSGGNFHGHPIALPTEYAKVAVASLGTIIERRINLLVDGEEYGLPAFLVTEPGLNSGYMVAHYLAAGLVSENRVLAHPSAVDSVPTSANIEDYNSMGATATRHLRAIVANVQKIVAIEALCAAQACDLRGLHPMGALGEIYTAIRDIVPPLRRDERAVADDIESMREMLSRGTIASIVQRLEETP